MTQDARLACVKAADGLVDALRRATGGHPNAHLWEAEQFAAKVRAYFEREEV